MKRGNSGGILEQFIAAGEDNMFILRRKYADDQQKRAESYVETLSGKKGCSMVVMITPKGAKVFYRHGKEVEFLAEEDYDAAGEIEFIASKTQL